MDTEYNGEDDGTTAKIDDDSWLPITRINSDKLQCSTPMLKVLSTDLNTLHYTFSQAKLYLYGPIAVPTSTSRGCPCLLGIADRLLYAHLVHDHAIVT